MKLYLWRWVEFYHEILTGLAICLQMTLFFIHRHVVLTPQVGKTYYGDDTWLPPRSAFWETKISNDIRVVIGDNDAAFWKFETGIDRHNRQRR